MTRNLHASVTCWLEELHCGCDEAAELIWGRYFDRLAAIARSRLKGAQQNLSDEEDVALSVLDTVIRGTKEGRFSRLRDRRDLWCLLLAITRQKVADVYRSETRQKRGGGNVRASSQIGQVDDHLFSMDDLCSSAPTPDFLVAMDEQNERLMSCLRNDELRRIASLSLLGHSSSEIATNLGTSQRTIQRKLDLIRTTWTDILVRDAADDGSPSDTKRD